MSEWQPIETAPTEGYILLSLANYSIPMIGRYEEDENGGAFYEGDDDKPLLKYGIFVNGWMELPKCICD